MRSATTQQRHRDADRAGEPILVGARLEAMPWDATRWPNFKPVELACRCALERPRYCRGEWVYWPDFFDRLQWARYDAGVPFRIGSGHRCGQRNAYVGGEPLSEHKRLAVDILAPLAAADAPRIYRALVAAGFTGLGFYAGFIHADLGRPRTWTGPGARHVAARRVWTEGPGRGLA